MRASPPLHHSTTPPLHHSTTLSPHAIWRDDFEEFEPDRWTEYEPAWIAPELDLGDGRRLVLDAPDPFPEEEWAVSGAN